MGIFRAMLPAAALLTLVHGAGLARAQPRVEEAKAIRLVAEAGKVAWKVSRIRGLRVNKPIARGVLTRAEIREEILQRLQRERTPHELSAESLGLKRLGLISADMDYAKTMVELLAPEIDGYYDFRQKKLQLALEAPRDGGMVLAQEVTHALQDQHFDLAAFLTTSANDGDSLLARRALVEGDGVATSLEFQLALRGQAPFWGNESTMRSVVNALERSASPSKVPNALRQSLRFPYVGGVGFIAHFRKHHGWNVIDAMYEKPPLSTEHILHPQKYESYEPPIHIAPKLPTSLAGFDERVSDVRGEFGVELFLRTHGVGAGRAIAAAAGWGGDRYVVYAKSGHRGSNPAGTVGIWMTAWDEELDAKEFAEALEHALPKLSGAAMKRTNDVMRFEAGPTNVIAERRDSRVLILVGASTKIADALRAEVWNGWKQSN